MSEKVDKIGVHVTHCCRQHGCKYGDDDCPVALGTATQEHACMYCVEDAVALRRDIQSIIHRIRAHGQNPEVIASADANLPFTREGVFAKLALELQALGERTHLPAVTPWSDEDDAAINDNPFFDW